MTHQSGNYLVPQSGGPESKLKKIRCRHCGKNALENLVICPHCGRELHPAPPRVLVWGLPIVLVVLFAMVVTNWGSSNPVTWVGQQWDRSRSLLTNMGQQIEPRLAVNEAGDVSAADASQQPLVAITSVENPEAEAAAEAEIQASEPVSAAVQSEPVVQMIVETPESADAEPAADIAADTPTVAPTDTAAPIPTNTAPPTATSEPTATETPVVVVSEVRPTETATTAATATAENTPTQTPTRAVSIAQLRATQTPTTAQAERTATAETGGAGVVAASSASSVGAASALASGTATPSRTSTATRTASPTPSSTATATSAPTATPTPAVLTYEVQAGDTLLAIANRFDTTVDTLMAYNGLSEADVRALRTGQVLSIPGQVAPAQSSADGAELESYTVQSGDTPMAIANRFGVSVDALMAVNGLSQADATRLRTGQVLLIPSEDSTSGASDGSDATPTSATTTSATSTAGSASDATEPAANEADYRVDAPRLRSPQDGTPVQCSQASTLVWAPVPYIGLSDKYILHLGYVSGYDGGDAQVTWVLAQQRDSTRTSWDMDSDYCALAPQDLGRQWHWYVEVVNENGVPISPPSEIWSFTWN